MTRWYRNGAADTRGTIRSLAPLSLALFLLVLAAPAAGEGRTSTLSFGGSEYHHRWSQGDQHEFTPAGQEDLESWVDMLTLIVYPDVWDGDALAATANTVLSSYQLHGHIVKVDSRRRTRKRPAEHLIVAVLATPELLEAVFARLMLAEDTGVAIVASHRIYGAAAGDAMSAWLAANGPAWEESLMSWKELPPLDSLDEPADAAAGLMAVLRGHLEIVRASPPPAKSKPWPRPDPSALVGLSREAVRAGLGSPMACQPGSSSQAADCERAERWIFRFYSLPEGSRGGGLELAVDFSPQGSVTAAAWRNTQ